MPVFQSTSNALQAMISTRGGMRRILKKNIPTIEFIRLAVETGVYRTTEEIEQLKKERQESTEDLRVIMNRFRQDIIRGSYIQDYPTEYLIMQQHPPIPDPPRTPLKLLRKERAPPNPIDRLTKKYLDRQQYHEEVSATKMTSEEYYRRLLGVQAAEARKFQPAMSQKPAAVQKAYAAAVKHYQLVRTEGLSEEEAMTRVEQLLEEQAFKEQQMGHARAMEAQAWRAGTRKPPVEEIPKIESALPFSFDEPLEDTKRKENENEDEDLTATLASIFNATPKTAEAMIRWSDRLNAVPYQQWTVGASTALDHWIARQLLGFSEETWQCILEGDDANDPTLISKGRDIVAVREALFPETILEPFPSVKDHDDIENLEDLDQSKDLFSSPSESGEPKHSVDELLEQLTSLKSSTSESQEYTAHQRVSGDDLDFKVDQLTVELQDWRRKNMDRPYENWLDFEKENFDSWLKGYITIVSNGTPISSVDIDSTREALLAEPPVDPEESKKFWDQLSDESQAAVLLDTMIQDGPPPGASILHSSFWDLSRKEQLERLLNLGALRPLLDEFTKESDRLRFLQRYGDLILEGVELDHLVVDPQGPVRVSDLSKEVVEKMRIPDDSRFRLERRPFKAGEDLSSMEKSHALFRAWNTQKAGRARYEEELFRTGRLGLRYGDEPAIDDYMGFTKKKK